MDDDDFFTIEDDGLLISFNERVTEAVIPDYVTGIGEEAFRQCASLKSVTIPASVKLIDYAAFQECESLENVEIVESVTEIGHYAFDGCKSLKSVTIPASVKKILEGAFQGCTSLEKVTLLGNPQMQEKVFKDCPLFKGVTKGASSAK